MLSTLVDILEQFGVRVLAVGVRGKKKYILLEDNIVMGDYILNLFGEEVMVTSDVSDFGMVRR